MVFAKTSKAAAALSAAIQKREFNKEYLCIVRGTPAEDAGIYTDLLLHDKTRNKTFVVDRMRGGVKDASLEYRVLAKDNDTSLIRVKLHTDGPIKSASSSPAARRPCWGTGNTAAEAVRSPCGVGVSLFRTPQQGNKCTSPICRKAAYGTLFLLQSFFLKKLAAAAASFLSANFTGSAVPLLPL